MFGLSFLEIFLVALVAFLVFGPEEFLVAMRNLGRLMRTLRALGDRVQDEMMEATKSVEKEIAKGLPMEPERPGPRPKPGLGEKGNGGHDEKPPEDRGSAAENLEIHKKGGS